MAAAAAAGDVSAQWSFGLKNHAGMYLTAEPFNFGIFCNSKVMKKKQIFFLEQVGNDLYIKSHLGRYLSFKATGKIFADSTTRGEEESLAIETQPDGRWALKTRRGYYVGGTGEQLDAYTKELKADRLWMFQLAMHPQVCMYNMTRKKYVHLAGDEVTTDEPIPWGSDPLITIVFFPEGKYALQVDDGRYISETGELKVYLDGSCKYTIDFKSQQVAFRCASGWYLAALGPKGDLRSSRLEAPGKDELFVLQDSAPQFKLRCKANGQLASTRRNTEVHCNQPEAADTEIFQFEMNPATKQWCVRTNTEALWSLGADGTITLTKPRAQASASEWFTALWMGPHLALKAANGNFVTAKKNGQLIATTATGLSDDNTFVYDLVNRPRLVLRGDHGFVGVGPAGLLEANHAHAEVFNMEFKDGQCKISTANGKRWKVGVSGVTANGDDADAFTLEFVEHSKFVIKAPNGKYLQGEQAGGFRATGTTVDASTLWEY